MTQKRKTKTKYNHESILNMLREKTSHFPLGEEGRFKAIKLMIEELKTINEFEEHQRYCRACQQGFDCYELARLNGVEY